MKTQINLFKSLDVYAKVKKSRDPVVTVLVSLLFISVVGVATFIYILDSQKTVMAAQIMQTESVFSGTETYIQADALKEKQLRTQSVETLINEVEKVQSLISGENPFSLSMYGVVNRHLPDGVSISTLDYSQSGLTVQCQTPKNIQPAEYAKTLEGLGVFGSVGYRGFSGNEESGFVFTITVDFPKRGSEVENNTQG